MRRLLASMEVTHALLNTAGFVCILLLLQRLSQRWKSINGGKLPPGPAGYPFIGNILDWPASKAWETFPKWAQLYGA
jgi:hypothetical protein